ncbi:27438_t:CDS:2, partial [Gigaspora margarita]
MDSDNNLFEIIPNNNMVKNVTTTSNSANIASNVSVSKKSSTRLPSSVKPFFSQKTIDNKSVLCSICKSKFSITTATGNLHKYLDFRHPGWEANKPIPNLPSHDVIKSIIQKAFTNILLDIGMLSHLHTGKEINAKLCSVFVAFNITNKILCATTEGGANMVLAMQLLKNSLILKNCNFNFQPRRCLAHILNLIVTTGLSPIKPSIEKVCNFVNIISSSLSITQDFKELGQTVGEGKSTRKIPQDVSTRWNSTYLMLSAYVTMSTMISAIIRRNKNLEKFKLTPQDETNLQVTTQFLKPFYETTNVLSGSTYTTLGILILLIDDIVENVSACIQDSTSPEFLKIATIQ